MNHVALIVFCQDVTIPGVGPMLRAECRTPEGEIVEVRYHRTTSPRRREASAMAGAIEAFFRPEPAFS